MNQFLIPMRDYGRIHKTIYSILESEDGNTEASCFYFCLFGASILRAHYRLNAKVVAGIAAYKLDSSSGDLLVFAENQSGQVVCSENGFHCWLEVDGWLIDFMGPLFHQMMLSRGCESSCEPWMMQKRLRSMSESIESMDKQGDFYLRSSRKQLESLERYAMSKRAYADLAEIAVGWYKRPPKKMMKSIPVADARGDVKNVSLQGKSLLGAW